MLNHDTIQIAYDFTDTHTMIALATVNIEYYEVYKAYIYDTITNEGLGLNLAQNSLICH